MNIPPIHTSLTMTGRPLLEWALADICLPDYWSGHHLPHVQIPVWSGMTLKQIKDALRDELRMGYVSGTCDAARILQADWVPPSQEKVAEALMRAAYAAVNRIKPAHKGQRKLFTDLEPAEDNDYSLYAYFVLCDREEQST